jgi:hypothetical protein
MQYSRQTLMTVGLAIAVAFGSAACSGDKTSPTSPSSASTSTVAGTGVSGTTADNGGLAAADGTTLKVTAPGNLQPNGRVRVDSRLPTLSWSASSGLYATPAGLTYEVEIYRENVLLTTFTQAATTYTFTTDIDYDIVYRWRVRARLGSAFGPWATTVDFLGPEPPPPPVVGPIGGGGQPYGPVRNIGINEAFSIIVAFHNATGADLGRNSTRESRVDFFFSAVAVVAYGHPQFNPSGGDRGWCVKDAGGGRPPSDDVIVRCGSRESWDLIGGAGAAGYSFHPDYIGVLPGGQNVYSPPLSYLPGSTGGAAIITGLPPLVDGTPVAVNGKIPDPPSGRRLPLPNMEAAVIGMGAEFATELRNSCGNFNWLDKVVDRLRQGDDRWGYNCKAGNCSNPAQDEIVYHWGSGTREGSKDVYTIDVITSHCGAVPSAGWRDFTGTENAGFTSRGRFTAIKP